MDKASTDGGEQQPSSLTGGLPNLQQAAIQPYQRPTQLCCNHPTPQPSTPTQQPKPLTRRGQSSETTE
uniref:hypothetical protein n=1 Tax=Prevotella sp. TaxID=59823 RepID=UPI004029E5D2